MFDGNRSYEYRSPEEIEKETATFRRGSLIALCLLLLVSYLAAYIQH
jgi:hypothetical protein